MPPERLTGTGSSAEWATFEDRDAVFEEMREKAVKSIDALDLISIESNNKLLDREMNYSFENPNSQLSSVVKNVIWGLWSYKEARENLFPENLLPKKKEGQTDEEAEAEAEKKLAKFIDDKSQHQKPEGKALINFAILAIRSGFRGMPLRRRIEEHIALQFEHFLSKYFEDWTSVLKNKNRKFDPDKYENDEEREAARIKFEQESKYRFRLLTLAKNSEQLHTQIFSRFSDEGSMNVFGYFLRHLLNVEKAGDKVKEIMIGVIDEHFDLKRKQFLDLLGKLKKESKEKAAKEREERLAAVDDVSDGVAAKAAANVSTSGSGKKVDTPSGTPIPVPEKITGPTSRKGTILGLPTIPPSDEASDTDVNFYDEDEYVDGADTHGEVTVVDPKYIPDPPKAKRKAQTRPTEYHEQTREVTNPRAPIPDKIIEPQKPIPAIAEVGSTPAPKPTAKATTPKVVKQYMSENPENSGEGTFNVIPPIPGIALRTPAPAKPPAPKSPPKPRPLPASLQNRIQKAAAAPQVGIPKKNRVEDITVPDLPEVNFEGLDSEKEVKYFLKLVREIQYKRNGRFTYMDAAREARSKYPVHWEKVKEYLLSKKIVTAEIPKSAISSLEPQQSWVERNTKSITAVIIVAVLGVLGGAGYLAYKHATKKQPTKGKTRVAAKTTTDDKSKQVITNLPRDMKEPIMAAPMAAPMARPMARPVMKAPVEVMKASMDVMKATPAPKPRPAVKPQPTPRPRTAPAPQKTVDVKGAMSNPRFASVDTKTIDDLPDGRYKEMWQGKKIKLKGEKSYSKYMEDALMDIIKKLPRKEKYKAMYAYYRELRKTEKGWLLRNALLKEKLIAKALTKEGLNKKEEAQLQDMNDYDQRHRGRARQGRRLLRTYKWLMRSKKKGAAHKRYEDYLARGVELMEFEGVAHVERSADNILPHEEISYATKDGKTLKTLVRFAQAIKKRAKSFPMPDLAVGSSTGSIDEGPEHIMFAEHHEPKNSSNRSDLFRLDETDMFDVQPIQSQGLATSAPKPPQAFGSAPAPELKPVLGNMLAKKPPRIPKDARVYQISPEDILEEKMLKPQDYGSAPMPKLKPVLGKIFADRKKPPEVPEDALPKIKDEDILEVRNITPPPIPVEDSQIIYEKDMAPEPPMYGAAPLPKEIKPILGVKPPAIPKDAISSTYDIPRGEGPETPPVYAEMTDNRMPKVGPPPIPAMADVPKEKPKKKGLFARAKKWLLG